MGVGGFLIVAACVMTFEARDNAAKVVPSTNSAQNEEKAKTRALKFRSSSSQTTFLDRNIVETLHVDPSSGSSVSPRGGNCKVLSAVGASAQVGVGSAAAATAGLFDLQNTFRPLAVPSNLNISGSTYSNKRASFNGKLPAASDFEPGLALMDEIGRRALTNAFIQFTRNTSNPSAYRDSLIYNIQPSQNYPKEDDGFRGSGHLEVGQAIPKCPSAPDIAHHKLDHNVTMSGHVASHRQKECVDGQVQGDSSSQQPEYEPLPTLRGQYRVLTPTMYRSRMAATRQAISMDCEGSNTAKTRREGPSLRIPSPFQNPIRKFAQDSLDLELGASATGVHNLANRGAAVVNSSSTEGHTAKSSNQSQRESREIYEEHSNSSMLLDLHLEGSAPVTLLVRDESRSTRSTSGNREAGSNNRSPPSLHEQMSCERLKLSCSRSNSNSSSSSSSSSSLPKQEETSIFGGSGSVEQEEDEEAEREAAHFDDHNEKRIRDRRKSFRQSKMRQKKHARQTRQRRNSDPSFDSSFDAGKDDASRLPDHCQRHHPQIASPSTLSDDDDEELLVVDSLHQATVTLKSQSSQLNVKFDVSKGPEIPTATVLQQNLEAVEGIGLEDDNNSINNRMQTILEEDAAVTISLVGALGAVGKKHFQGQKASKSCDDPVVTPPTPFGSYKRQERWSKSLAEEMATLSFIDTSPIEERENKPPRTVLPSNMRASSSDHYHYYYHHHRSPPSTRHDQPEPSVSQSFASLASEEETSSPDEGGTLKRNNKVQTGFRSDYRSVEGAGPMRAQSTSTYSKSEPLLYAAKIYDPEEEELFLDIAEDSISLSPEAFPVTYSAELPPPPKPFDDHMLRGTIDPRSEDRTRSNLEQCQPMSVPLVGSCPRSHQEKRSGI
ncbi:uncharacterized protein LOC131885344 [Tigriopus californicus]|uniref:uncharacterized protein LOC131885344 n=1 Tax=Tigriopus californicus TaxID=6832 RepID=UPI0027DA4AC7|nr:uncharacterized protein LOC131885344 [Tigriopus californicus]